jgi:hypothetical protein
MDRQCQRRSHGIGEVALYDLMPGSSAGGGVAFAPGVTKRPRRACGARKPYPESKVSLFAVKSRVLRHSSDFGDRRAGAVGK